jgi:uncharacterized protein (TIGR03435 family)
MRMAHRRTFAAAWLAFSALAGWSQEPPALNTTEWLQAPDRFDGQWSGMRGKVVVLEFWATWCSPCIHAIPHLNQLADQFQDQGVIFLAVTDDDADRAKTFLARQPMKAIVGIDTGRRNWKAFAVPSVPHTVLVGKDGGVIGATLPENITAEVLRDALAGKRLALPPKEGIESDLSWDEHSIAWQDGVVPAIYGIIKPIRTTTSGAWPRPDHVTADGVPLEVLVQIAYQTDNYHMDWRMPKDDQVYRAAFRVPEERKERLLPYMRQTLAELFGMQARWENRDRDVYVLRRIEGHAAPAESRSEHDLVQMLRGKITLRRQPAAKLCDFLGNSFHAIVMNETGLDGAYDFDIPYQPGQPDVTTAALKDIGLEAVPSRRNVRVLVVSPEGAAQEKKP